MTHHLFLACNPSFLLFSEELFSDTRLSQQPTGGVHLHIEDWLAGVQRSSRQKKPLKMQNKPNLLYTQMNISSAITMNYEQLTMNYANKNKPNSKPIKPNTNPISEKPKMNLNFYSAKNYDNKSGLLMTAKQTQTNPISTAKDRQFFEVDAKADPADGSPCWREPAAAFWP